MRANGSSDRLFGHRKGTIEPSCGSPDALIPTARQRGVLKIGRLAAADEDQGCQQGEAREARRGFLVSARQHDQRSFPPERHGVRGARRPHAVSQPARGGRSIFAMRTRTSRDAHDAAMAGAASHPHESRRLSYPRRAIILDPSLILTALRVKPASARLFFRLSLRFSCAKRNISRKKVQKRGETWRNVEKVASAKFTFRTFALCSK